MKWDKLMPHLHMVCLLEGEFFPRWLAVLIHWLQNDPDFEEVSGTALYATSSTTLVLTPSRCRLGNGTWDGNLSFRHTYKMTQALKRAGILR